MALQHLTKNVLSVHSAHSIFAFWQLSLIVYSVFNSFCIPDNCK